MYSGIMVAISGTPRKQALRMRGPDRQVKACVPHHLPAHPQREYRVAEGNCAHGICACNAVWDVQRGCKEQVETSHLPQVAMCDEDVAGSAKVPLLAPGMRLD